MSKICPPSSCVSPVYYPQNPSGGELDAIDFVAIAIPSLCSLHRAHIKRRRLIMPLVALVQNNRSAPATAYFCLVLGVRFLVAAAPRVPSSNE